MVDYPEPISSANIGAQRVDLRGSSMWSFWPKGPVNPAEYIEWKPTRDTYIDKIVVQQGGTLPVAGTRNTVLQMTFVDTLGTAYLVDQTFDLSVMTQSVVHHKVYPVAQVFPAGTKFYFSQYSTAVGNAVPRVLIYFVQKAAEGTTMQPVVEPKQKRSWLDEIFDFRYPAVPGEQGGSNVF